MKTASIHLELSERYWDRARRIIPAGTQTLSKGPTQYVDGVAPKYLRRGKGSHVWDVDGNEYIDYGMGLHPIILGYGYPAVDEAIRRQLEDGITFTLMHPLEVDLAEVLIDTIPCAEAVRYGKNGSDVTAAAVRLARAFTGRDKVACCGYHGWQDWYIGTTERNKGVPDAVKKLSFPFRYNDLDSLERIFRENRGEIACVIMEPVGVVPPENDFLMRVKELTHREGAVLIFDEVITGFRIALGGAQEFFGVTPDLATFGKAMANGMPLSVLVGKKEIMDRLNDVFFSFTFGGEALSLAAAMATIQELKAGNVLDFVWSQGKRLQDGFNRLAEEMNLVEFVRCIGYSPKTAVQFDGRERFDPLEMKSLVQQEMIREGILWAGFHAVSYSHGDADVIKTLTGYEAALSRLREAIHEGNIRKYLEGKPVQPVFRSY